MKESYGEGLATHTAPESCGAVCEDRVEALTGARAGRASSRERRLLRDADAVGESGRHHREHRYREMLASPARSETPCTYGRTSCGSREVPCSPVAVGPAGRVGKSKDVRR
jgi:RNA-directed DNA polymerase